MERETCAYDLETSEILAFGNSPLTKPLQKVTFGAQKFRTVVMEAANSSDLSANLLNFLKSSEKYYPDAELFERTGNNSYALSSIFVQMPEKRFGTRTHTIVTVNRENEMVFMEETKQNETLWTQTCFKLKI